jgi:hypothetical protein
MNYFSDFVHLAGYPAFSVSGIWPDIRQVKYGIRPDTGYLKRSDYPIFWKLRH